MRAFAIKSDLEFYCYLKAHLPDDYTIVSEPSASYYSEWSYCYVIYYKGECFARYSGNFLTVPPGSLMREADRILDRMGARC